jgi:uncharacterized protein
MILYLDTSALVKVYINESFSDIVRKAFLDADTIAISIIGFVEFHSAISRLLRENLINKIQLKKVKDNFNENWPKFKIIDLDNNIIKRASELIYKTELRAFDSIHLASAETLKNITENDVIFGCFDKRLINGAKHIGMALIGDIEI